MINLKFYTLQERLPDHNQEIVYLEYGSTYGVDSVGIRTGKVEYIWLEAEGTGYAYTEGESLVSAGYELCVLIDGYNLEGKNAWCTVEEYFCAIEKGTE
jgi:hypothetical protein